jgi:hypothetical protein
VIFETVAALAIELISVPCQPNQVFDRNSIFGASRLSKT